MSLSGSWHQRKQTIVHRGFQFGFAFKLFLIQIIVTLSLQGALQLKLNQLVEKNTSGASLEFIDQVWAGSFWTMLFVGLTTGVMVFLLGLWYSNRIVGPLPRFKGGLRSLRDGDYSARLSFRPGDALYGICQEFNDAAASLQDRHGQQSRPSAQADGSSRETEETPLTV